MEKQFIPYELALELKKLGFDEPCFGCYDYEKELVLFQELEDKTFWRNKNIPECEVASPLFQQAFYWFRDVMLLDNFIIPYWFIDGEYKVKKYTYSIEPSNRFDEYFDCDSDQYDTYEEARLECLKRLIELCEA